MRCSAITGTRFSAHDLPTHPECNERLLNACTGIPPKCPIYSPEQASVADLKRIHDRSYISWIEDMCAGTTVVKFLDPDTYITRHSFEVAALAAGSAMAAADRAIDGEHCFAFVRPPGHHAEHNRAIGFCLFNNIAVAAVHALDSLDRVAIVDWDYHHGNGTQHAFYSDSRVLYCSVHQSDAFPFTGSPDETGIGKGRGFTINVPIQASSSLADYANIFLDVFNPALARFRPDVILVSAGQDILSDDPLGMMNIRPADFEVLTSLLRQSAGGTLAFVLEGGYGPSHGEAISAVFAGLKRDQRITEDFGQPHRSTVAIIEHVQKIHRLV